MRRGSHFPTLAILAFQQGIGRRLVCDGHVRLVPQQFLSARTATLPSMQTSERIPEPAKFEPGAEPPRQASTNSLCVRASAERAAEPCRTRAFSFQVSGWCPDDLATVADIDDAGCGRGRAPAQQGRGGFRPPSYQSDVQNALWALSPRAGKSETRHHAQRVVGLSLAELASILIGRWPRFKAQRQLTSYVATQIAQQFCAEVPPVAPVPCGGNQGGRDVQHAPATGSSQGLRARVTVLTEWSHRGSGARNGAEYDLNWAHPQADGAGCDQLAGDAGLGRGLPVVAELCGDPGAAGGLGDTPGFSTDHVLRGFSQ